MKQKLLVSGLLILLAILFPGSSYAHHRQRVLGVSATSGGSSDLQIPPTVEGPGFILPDSPFFFLDQFKQNIRLSFAFTAEQKAKIYSDIAGERGAELRVMLVRNNTTGIKTAILGISDNLKLSSEELENARLTGRDVSTLARKINDNIKLKQQTFDFLEQQTTGEIDGLVKISQESLMDSKVRVEDNLSEEELTNEIRYNLNRIAQRRVEETSKSARALENDLEHLQNEASKAAAYSLQRRQEALKKAIADKDDQMRKTEEILVDQERKKQENLLKLQGEAAREAKKAVEEAKKAAERFKTSTGILEEARNQDASQNSTNPSSVLNTTSNSSGNRSIISP